MLLKVNEKMYRQCLEHSKCSISASYFYPDLSIVILAELAEPKFQSQSLWPLPHTASRTLSLRPWSEYVTVFLRNHSWVPCAQRIKFKSYSLTTKANQLIVLTP